MTPTITVAPLQISPSEPNPSSFSQYGTIVSRSAAPYAPTTANQSTAQKYSSITPFESYYSYAPSRTPAAVASSLYVSSPRAPRPHPSRPNHALLTIPLLERHPYTTQTFLPINLAADDPNRRYLVVVAPTLPTNSSSASVGPARPPPFPLKRSNPPRPKRSLTDLFRRARPAPFPLRKDEKDSETTIVADAEAEVVAGSEKKKLPRGPGMPDVARAQAYIFHGGQGVTYAAGTWHSPMITLGGDVEFVVMQYANGVPLEDCQEVLIKGDNGGNGLVVEVPEMGILRARL